MSHDATTEDLFFRRAGLDGEAIADLVKDALAGADDGELFLEYRQSESVSLDDGRIKSASFDTVQGFGLRAVSGEATGYAHASELMVKRGDQVKRGQIIARSGQTGNVSAPQLHFEIRKGKVPVDPVQFLPAT